MKINIPPSINLTSTKSNILKTYLKYQWQYTLSVAPICKPDATPKLLGISFKKPSSILCEVVLIKVMNSNLRRFFKVEAYPSSVSFRWFFNNSEYQEWKDHGDFTQSGLKSQLEFLPKTSKDQIRVPKNLYVRLIFHYIQKERSLAATINLLWPFKVW